MNDSATRRPEVLIVGAGPTGQTRRLSSLDLLPQIFRRVLLPTVLRPPFVTKRMARKMVDV